MANRTKLHVVEFRKDRDYVPIIQASPADGDMRTDVNEEEDLDFERLYFNGKVLVKRPPKRSVFHRMRSWHHKKRIVHRRRNQSEAQIERLALGIDREGRYAEPMEK